MKKLILLLILVSILCIQLEAKKKKADYIKYISGLYLNNDGDKKIGDVYILTIETKINNVQIDSVWFGYTPVPCDLLESKTNQKIELAQEKGVYIVRANKNLYQNFHAQYDSTIASKHFQAPLTFKGDAIIMYKVKGRRYYKSVDNVIKGKSKGSR